MADSKSSQKRSGDLVKRGDKQPSPFGSLTFVLCRSIDPLIQVAILTRTNPLNVINNLPTTWVGLTSYQRLLTGLAVGSSAKQIFWLLVTSQEAFPASSALIVSVFNTIINGFNSFLATTPLTSVSSLRPPWTEYSIYLGIGLYSVGILTETISEVQRYLFKRNPSNKGKPYSNGLFGLARNINYGGYTLWRTGYATAAAGPIWGMVVGSFFAIDFARRAIPSMDEYCAGRYGEQWEKVKRKVPYVLIPGIC